MRTHQLRPYMTAEVRRPLPKDNAAKLAAFSHAGPASIRKQGNVTAHRIPNAANAGQMPLLPNIAKKQETENDTKKPNKTDKAGIKIIPIEEKPSNTTNNG